MHRYFLHCTDGIDIVLDGQGVRAETREEALRYATSLSERLMHSVPDYEDWESWLVCVYDEHDRLVGTVGFRKPVPVESHHEIAEEAEPRPALSEPEPPPAAQPYPSVRDVCRHVRSVCTTAAARFRRQAREEGTA